MMCNSKRLSWVNPLLFSLLLCLFLLTETLLTSCQDRTEYERTTSSVNQSAFPIQSNLPAPSEGVVRIGGKTAATGVSGDPSASSDEGWQTFTYRGVPILPGDQIEHILSSLGDPKSIYETPSCFFDGNDRVYSYEAFDVNSAVIDGKETCVAVIITGSSVKTPEGIAIGSSAADVQSAYGAYDSEETGQYVWHRHGAELVIVIIEDQVTSISYILKTTS